MGFYDAEDPSRPPIILSNVLISDFDDLTEVDISSLPKGFKLGAVYLNQNNHMYANVDFDQYSINWFKQNLQYVQDAETRA